MGSSSMYYPEPPTLTTIADSESIVSFVAVLETDLEAWEGEKEAVLEAMAARLGVDKEWIECKAEAYNSIKVSFDIRLLSTSDTTLDAAHLLPAIKAWSEEIETGAVSKEA